MALVAPIISKIDLIMSLSNLWDNSDSCMFIDSSEENYKACSITFFQGQERATIGLAYTKDGGAARVFNGQMNVVAQSIEKFTLEDYHGIYNMLLKIQQSLPRPIGLSAEDILGKKGKK